MAASEILEQLAPWRDAQKRSSWDPVVEAGDADAIASKFSGMPWLAADEPYPCCGDCGEPMTFFLQLNLNQLPAALADQFGSGLLQMFYCTECDSFEPFDTTKLVRIVQPDGPGQALAPGSYPAFPAQTIVGWVHQDDYPQPQEFDQHGLTFVYNFSQNTIRIECPAVDLALAAIPMAEAPEAEDLCTALPGDKLGGYPFWVQGEEYPYCPECDRKMVLVFQIDSEDNLPFMFGDVGCGHITQCPDHKHILTFSWACG